MVKKSVEAECSSCGGTGLYTGFAEHDGAAVVCSHCKGTGKMTISYTPFTCRKGRRDVERVFQANVGITVGAGDGKHELSDFGGMPHKEWVLGMPFPPGSEMRQFVCPAWWYQGVDWEKKPKWGECIGIGSFSDCPHFSSKDECWARWDKEHKFRRGKKGE